jgi:NADH-quinone oxidoreductase subunit J
MTIGGSYFICCALISLVGAFITILARSPVRGALGLLTTIIGIAGFFLQLDAQFLAAIQIIVYAGAVVVLFVFAILLLGAEATDSGGVGKAQVARAIAGVGMVSLVAAAVFLLLPETMAKPLTLPKAVEGHGTVGAVGQQLFTKAIVPFELATALLIVAVVGAIAVARGGRHPKKQANQQANMSKRMFGGPVHPRDAGHPIVKGAES